MTSSIRSGRLLNGSRGNPSEGRLSTAPFTNMIYIIPGLGEKKYNLPKEVQYLHLSMDDVFNLPKIPSDSILIGFSVGAILAYFLALKNPVKRLILCSPSPVILSPIKIEGEVYVLSGKKESPHMRKYAKKLAKKVGKFIEVDAGHKLDKRYVGNILKCCQAVRAN